MYHNYKSFHSIVLLAIADADYRFQFVNVGCEGSIGDAGLFLHSDMMQVKLGKI